MLKALKVALLAAVFTGVATAASAGPIFGSTILGEFYFPGENNLYGNFSYSVNPFVVGAGVESVLSVDGAPRSSVDFSNESLVFTFLGTVGFSGAAFNGPQFTVLAGNGFDPILSVVASGGQTVVATLVGGELHVNWQGQQFLTGQTVTVNFNAVPEPGTLILLGTGVAAIVRRRLRARA